MSFNKIDRSLETAIKWIEIVLAIILILLVIAEGIYIVIDLLHLVQNSNLIAQSQVVLDDFLILVVTLEFALMLIRKNPYAIVDIFMIALARKVVLEYKSSTDYLIAIITFTILILIRKYLSEKKNSKKESEFNLPS